MSNPQKQPEPGVQLATEMPGDDRTPRRLVPAVLYSSQHAVVVEAPHVTAVVTVMGAMIAAARAAARERFIVGLPSDIRRRAGSGAGNLAALSTPVQATSN